MESKKKNKKPHTEVPHDLIEAFAKIPFELSQNEWRIIFVIIRKTYGWHKDSDSISLRQFAEATGISQPNIPGILKKLAAKKLIIEKKGNAGKGGRGHASTYSMQTDSTLWKRIWAGDILSDGERILAVDTLSNGEGISFKGAEDILSGEKRILARDINKNNVLKETSIKETTADVGGSENPKDLPPAAATCDNIPVEEDDLTFLTKKWVKRDPNHESKEVVEDAIRTVMVRYQLDKELQLSREDFLEIYDAITYIDQYVDKKTGRKFWQTIKVGKFAEKFDEILRQSKEYFKRFHGHNLYTKSMIKTLF